MRRPRGYGILPRLEGFLLQSSDSTILLVPSINGVISGHATFLQSELEPEFSRDPVCRTLFVSGTFSNASLRRASTYSRTPAVSL